MTTDTQKLIEALIEFFEASECFQMTIGHPEATPQDEHRAESRYFKARGLAKDALAAHRAQQEAALATGRRNHPDDQIVYTALRAASSINAPPTLAAVMVVDALAATSITQDGEMLNGMTEQEAAQTASVVGLASEPGTSVNDGALVFARVMEYQGKRRREVQSPCLTARECIALANYIHASDRAAMQEAAK